ncbi:MAG: hypothetical protein MUC88_07920 [Planctomycetes bacterium]|jgi:hypothetical protein|nr:hypothetical protein [Planctomycetota bacterium]
MDGIRSMADGGWRMADLLHDANPPSEIPNPQSPAVDRPDEKRQQVARDFESVLLTKLFDEVQQSLGEWELDDEDGTGQQVQGLFWFYLARDAADKGGFGLWKDIHQHLQQMDRTSDPAAILNEEL